MKLQYFFTYESQSLNPLPVVESYTSPLPSQDNLILFGGEEAEILKQAGLPAAVWRVKQLAFDMSGQEVTRVTISLEFRNKKLEREIAAKN